MATARTRGMHARQVEGHKRRGTSEGQIVFVEPRLSVSARIVASSWASVGIEEVSVVEVVEEDGGSGLGLALGFLAMPVLGVLW